MNNNSLDKFLDLLFCKIDPDFHFIQAIKFKPRTKSVTSNDANDIKKFIPNE